MVIAFVESIKYVGHLYPVAFLRIFLGYYYLNNSILKFTGDYLARPELAAMIQNALPTSHAPDWYKSLLTLYVIPNWQFFAYVVIVTELLIAASYLLGYLVRPIGLLAIVMSLNFLLMSGIDYEPHYKTLMVIHITMAWIGAGRCLGLDYFYFKRRRGIWW